MVWRPGCHAVYPTGPDKSIEETRKKLSYFENHQQATWVQQMGRLECNLGKSQSVIQDCSYCQNADGLT